MFVLFVRMDAFPEKVRKRYAIIRDFASCLRLALGVVLKLRNAVGVGGWSAKTLLLKSLL